MPTLTRRGFVAAALASAGALSPFHAHAQDKTTPRGPQSLTEKTGNRFIWFGSSASIPGVRSQLEPDPEGNWVNKLTGQHFRQFDTPGPAGAGYVVFDVLSTTDNGYLSWMTSLLIHTDAGNATSFITANGTVSGAPNFGDYWMPPEHLAGVADQNGPGLRVLRMPYPLDRKTYRAIRIQFQSADGWSQSTYDLDTGLLLVASSTTQGGPVLTLGPNNQTTVAPGNTLLTYTRIAGVRRTDLPGAGETYPPAMRRLRTLTYNGSRGIIMAGTNVPPTPLQVRYDIASNEGSYLSAHMTISGLTGGSLDMLIPAGVIGSLWMNPDTLARTRANQVLDQDPITGVRAVALGSRDNLGFVSLQTPLAQQTFGYDLRNGLLTRAELRQQVGPATDVLTSQLAGAQ